MANDVRNVRLSACRVRWGGRDLGLTAGGVDITVKTSTKKIHVDSFGPVRMDEIITNRIVSVKCPFAETDLDTLYTLTRQCGATLSDSGTIAAGTITFSGVPAIGDTLTINGHAFTFATFPSDDDPSQPDLIPIGGTIAGTVQNLLGVVQDCPDMAVQLGTYAAALGATAVAVAFYRSGADGNAFTLAKGSSVIALSGATLTGGGTGTRSVVMSAGAGIWVANVAQPLVLHPADLPDDDQTEDVTVLFAGQTGSIDFSYSLENMRIFQVEFTGYPNRADNRLLMVGPSFAALTNTLGSFILDESTLG